MDARNSTATPLQSSWVNDHPYATTQLNDYFFLIFIPRLYESFIGIA